MRSASSSSRIHLSLVLLAVDVFNWPGDMEYTSAAMACSLYEQVFCFAVNTHLKLPSTRLSWRSSCLQSGRLLDLSS